MNTKDNIKKKIISGDRVSMLILSSLFVAIMMIAGCGRTATMHTVSQHGTEEESENNAFVAAREADNTYIDDGEELFNEKQEENYTVREAPGDITVYICGAVTNPGVYAFHEGDRIIDAVEMAGGLADEAGAVGVNLAEMLYDCERIYIPTQDEVMQNHTLEGIYTGPNSEKQEAQNTDSAGHKININTAEEGELQKITGIGATRAKSIISYRETVGRFKSIEDIKNVSGIGEASFEKMKDMITVD